MRIQDFEIQPGLTLFSNIVRTSLLSSLAFSSAIVSPNSLTTFLHSEADTWRGNLSNGLNPHENLVEVHREDVVGPGVPLVQRVPQQVQVVQIEVGLVGEVGDERRNSLVLPHQSLDTRELEIQTSPHTSQTGKLFAEPECIVDEKEQECGRTITCSIDFSSLSNVCLISS